MRIKRLAFQSLQSSSQHARSVHTAASGSQHSAQSHSPLFSVVSNPPPTLEELDASIVMFAEQVETAIAVNSVIAIAAKMVRIFIRNSSLL
jgi:hypothetical protein